MFDMTRSSTICMVIALILILAVWLGWLRRQIVTRSFRAIYADLKARQVELSSYERQLLLGQLNWNQNAVIEGEPRAELRAVKEPHVRSLKSVLIWIRAGFWILIGAGVGALVMLAES